MNVTTTSRGKLNQPSFITLLRNPIDWFQSQYYSCRYGIARLREPLGKCRNMPTEKLDMDLEQCIESEQDECTRNRYRYIEYLCGKFEECDCVDKDDDHKARAAEIAKHRILHDFHWVGISEHMEQICASDTSRSSVKIRKLY